MPSTPPKLLILDDDANICVALSRQLRREYEITTFTSVSVALSQIETGQHFDVGLVDLNMPEMAGTVFLSHLGQVAPELARRCVLMSGVEHSLQQHRGGLVLVKPWTIEELRRVLELAQAS